MNTILAVACRFVVGRQRLSVTILVHGICVHVYVHSSTFIKYSMHVHLVVSITTIDSVCMSTNTTVWYCGFHCMYVFLLSVFHYLVPLKDFDYTKSGGIGSEEFVNMYHMLIYVRSVSGTYAHTHTHMHVRVHTHTHTLQQVYNIPTYMYIPLRC